MRPAARGLGRTNTHTRTHASTHAHEQFLKSNKLERNRKTGFKCPRGCGKGTTFKEPCPGKIDKSHPIHPRNEDSKKKKKVGVHARMCICVFMCVCVCACTCACAATAMRMHAAACLMARTQGMTLHRTAPQAKLPEVLPVVQRGPKKKEEKPAAVAAAAPAAAKPAAAPAKAAAAPVAAKAA